jgi:hypothetical protein
MDKEHHSDQQTGNGKAITDFLHSHTSGTKSRRGNIRTAEVVDDNSDGNVDSGHSALADDQRASIVFRVAHLRHNGEECRCTGVGEDHRGHGGDGFTESGIGDELVVGYPDSLLRGQDRAVLNADSDGDDEDYSRDRLGLCYLLRDQGDLLAMRIQISPIHASQLIFPSVRILAKAIPETAATAT